MADLSTPEGKLVERLKPAWAADEPVEGSNKLLAAQGEIVKEITRERDAMARASLSAGNQAATAILKLRAAQRERDELKAEVERLREALKSLATNPLVTDGWVQQHAREALGGSP